MGSWFFIYSTIFILNKQRKVEYQIIITNLLTSLRMEERECKHIEPINVDTGGKIPNSWRHRSCQHVLTWRFILIEPDRTKFSAGSSSNSNILE